MGAPPIPQPIKQPSFHPPSPMAFPPSPPPSPTPRLISLASKEHSLSNYSVSSNNESSPYICSELQKIQISPCNTSKLFLQEKSKLTHNVLTKHSRHLCELLRHNVFIIQRGDGFVSTLIIKKFFFQKYNSVITDAIIFKTTENYTKKRFEIYQSADLNHPFWCRAVQDHSAEVSKRLNSSSIFSPLTGNIIKDFPVCTHGTFYEAWKAIHLEGLSSQNR